MPDDYSADTHTTGRVSVGGAVTGEIEYHRDRDWFAVELEAGRTYQFDLEGASTGAGTLLDPLLRWIHDADGNRIQGTINADGGVGENSRETFTPSESGTYYVAAAAFRPQEGAEGSQGTYRLSVTDVTPPPPPSDDFSADTQTTGTVTVGGSVTGEIEYHRDRDWFAVELEAGRTYQFDLEGASTGAGTLLDPLLRWIHDADGNRIQGTINADGGVGENSRETFTPSESGTYYVAAAAFRPQEGAEGSQGTYRLSVTDVTPPPPPSDDFSADTQTTGTVTVGGSVTGEIEVGGDRDWFAVELDASRTYQFDLEGSPTGAGTLSDPRLYGIHVPDGRPLRGLADDNSGTGSNSRVTFPTVGATGTYTYYVAVGGDGAHEGTYRLSVADVTPPPPADDYSADTQTAGTVSVGGSATGEIEVGGDRDWFAVELEADRTYRFDLEGLWTGAGTLFNPFLRGIHDADGNLIGGTKDDDSGKGYNSRVTFTAEESGTYYVAAGGYGANQGTYTLLAEEVI